MSDIERICEINHKRRKWAEEVEKDCGAEIATSAAPPRNDRETDCHGLRPRNDSNRRKCLRTACTACMMFCGGGAAFVGMGIVMGHWQTIVLGSLIAVVFLLTGCRVEGMLEEGRREHV